jgi:hypothetical protein
MVRDRDPGSPTGGGINDKEMAAEAGKMDCGRKTGEPAAKGLSGISCVGHDDGKEGTLAWHAAKHRLSLTYCSTSFSLGVIRKPPLAGMAWSTS